MYMCRMNLLIESYFFFCFVTMVSGNFFQVLKIIPPNLSRTSKQSKLANTFGSVVMIPMIFLWKPHGCVFNKAETLVRVQLLDMSDRLFVVPVIIAGQFIVWFCR